MGTSDPPSTRTVIERALDDTIARLARSEPTAQVRAALIEARRLRSFMASWSAIPPPAASRREMLSRVMQLAATAGNAVGDITGKLAAVVPGADPAAAGASAKPSDAPLDEQEGAGRDSGPPTPGATSILGGASSVRRTSGPGGFASAAAVAMALTTGPVADGSNGSHDERRVAIARGITLVRPETLSWRPVPSVADVSIKVLHRDPASGTYTGLVRLQPGAELPRHRHATPESIFVLEGAARIGDVEARAGEYCHSESGSIHDPIQSVSGCTLLVVGSEGDEILEG